MREREVWRDANMDAAGQKDRNRDPSNKEKDHPEGLPVAYRLHIISKMAKASNTIQPPMCLR